MKTKEELEQIKEDYKNLNKKQSELTEEDLKKVAGGQKIYYADPCIQGWGECTNPECSYYQQVVGVNVHIDPQGKHLYFCQFCHEKSVINVDLQISDSTDASRL